MRMTAGKSPVTCLIQLCGGVILTIASNITAVGRKLHANLWDFSIPPSVAEKVKEKSRYIVILMERNMATIEQALVVLLVFRLCVSFSQLIFRSE